MPNIETYSLTHPQVESLRKYIKNGLPKEIFEETVFTISLATVINFRGRSAPYVRIVDNNLEVAHKIQELINDRFDVEILIISEFHPKKLSAKNLFSKRSFF